MLHFSQLSRLCYFAGSNRRRAARSWSATSCESLEVRQMLSAVAVDVHTGLEVGATSTVEYATSEHSVKSSRHADSRDGATFVKPWQGTWNLSTDVPFMADGTITINQTSNTPKGTTAMVTGLSGATVRKIKVVGDVVLALQLSVFNSISERTVKVTTALVHTSDLLHFQGDAKVQGGGAHEHTFLGERVSGPGSAMVDLTAYAIDSDVRGDRVVPGTATFQLTNLGEAGIPQGGSQFLIVFNDEAGVPGKDVQIGRIWHIGFASVQPTVVDGHTALICVSNQWLNPNRKSGSAGIAMQVTPPTDSGIEVTGKLTDVAGHPIIPETQAIVSVH